MAFKFLSRPEAKQRIFRIDLAQAAASKKDARAVVVTAEAERLTYFWNDAGGEWRFHTRAHAPLQTPVVTPEGTLGFPWSRRQGVAAEGDLTAVVFKRELGEKDPSALYVDLLRWEEPEWRLLTEEAPFRVPLDDGCVGAGVDLWASMIKRELLVVTQAWVRRSQVSQVGPIDPRLVLLRATIDPDDPGALAQNGAWTRTNLDAGGFDLDARLEKDRLWVVHKRRGHAMSVPFKPTSDAAAVLMLDETPMNMPNLDELLVVADMPRTVLVSVALDGAAPRIEAEDIPSVEHPQIHRADPVILTGDRLRFAALDATRQEGEWDLRPWVPTSDKVIVWRGRDGWRMKRTGDIRYNEWPLCLRGVVASQWMVSLAEERIALATLLPLKPMHLWRFDVTTKGVEMTFAREDRSIGGVGCHLFRASPSLETGEPVWEGMSLLDIGHEQIALGLTVESTSPEENTQFEGLISETVQRAGGGNVNLSFRTVNTLGGLLVSHQDAGPALCAYAGMGDGGGRVIFEAEVAPMAPTTNELFKALDPGVVSGPGGAGRAWVTVEAEEFVESGLPGYFAPYGDFMRRVQVPGDPFTGGVMFATVFLPAEMLLANNTPRSLGGGFQPLLDVLPVANALLNPDSGATLQDMAPAAFELTREAALSIQATMAASVPAAARVVSGPDQPFAASIAVTPGLVQAGTPVTLLGRAPGVTDAVFAWAFTPPQDAPDVAMPFTLAGAQVTVPLIVDGRWGVRLTVDAPDGRRAVADMELAVEPSLWDQVWAAHRNAGGEDLRLGTTTLELMRHRVEFRRREDGVRDLVRVEYLPAYAAQFRFVEGDGAQQGRAVLRLPVSLSSLEGRLSGWLRDALVVKRLELRLWVERAYTLGVVTSDRRSFDVLRRAQYADLDSTGDVEVPPEEADVETVREFGYSIEQRRASAMTPSALAAKPVGPTAVTVRDVSAEIDFTPAAGTIAFLVAAVLGLGLSGMIVSGLLAAVLAVLGPAAVIGGVLALPLAALVAVAVGLGLGWLFLELGRAALRAAGNAVVQDRLRRPETIAAIREGLEEAEVMAYAGEGLAETIATRAVRAAISAGHAVAPTAYDEPGEQTPPGRERFRHQLFETVVVGPGVCRLLMRV